MPGILMITLIPLSLVFWFWALTDITRSRFINPGNRTLFLLIVLLFPLGGALIYAALRKQLTTEERRKFRPNFHRTSTRL